MPKPKKPSPPKALPAATVGDSSSVESRPRSTLVHMQVLNQISIDNKQNIPVEELQKLDRLSPDVRAAFIQEFHAQAAHRRQMEQEALAIVKQKANDETSLVQAETRSIDSATNSDARSVAISNWRPYAAMVVLVISFPFGAAIAGITASVLGAMWVVLQVRIYKRNKDEKAADASNLATLKKR